MDNKRNLYRILHVQPDAPLEIIRSSFRTLMQTMKEHPDLGGDPLRARVIIHAYEVLSHPDKRKAYNDKLADERHPVMQFAGRSNEVRPQTGWSKFVPPSF